LIPYPKIETLFDRDEKTFRVDEERLRMPEFDLIKYWKVTEKVDGTNVRIHLRAGYNTLEKMNPGPSVDIRPRVEFGGRTENAQMPTRLLTYLQQEFTAERFFKAFRMDDEVVLFGEGYGGKIQKGGNYRPDEYFRLIDVYVRGGEEKWWWLKEDDVWDVAGKMELAIVPTLSTGMTIQEIVDMVKNGANSVVAAADSGISYQQEGIVARTEPLLFTRSGERLMWKLKTRDFTGGKQ
jgi:hypothetical protein